MANGRPSVTTTTAVLVTRGDVNLEPIIASLPPKWPVVIWDNSTKKADMKVYGRYAALREVETSHVYFQDDDVIVSDPRAIAAACEPGKVVCNMPLQFRHDFYRDHALVGFGSVCETELPAKAFSRFWSYAIHRVHKEDLNPGGVVSDFFHRTADVIFTGLSERVLVDVPCQNLPWCDDADRMWKQPDHQGERTRMLDFVREVRDA